MTPHAHPDDLLTHQQMGLSHPQMSGSHLELPPHYGLDQQHMLSPHMPGEFISKRNFSCYFKTDDFSGVSHMAMGISPDIVNHQHLSQEGLASQTPLRSDHHIQPRLPEQPLDQLQEDLPPMDNMGYDQVSYSFLVANPSSISIDWKLSDGQYGLRRSIAQPNAPCRNVGKSALALGSRLRFARFS